MFARALYIFFAIAAVAYIAYAYMYNLEGSAVYVLLFIVPAAIFYVFAPQINWWYYQKRPEKTDKDLKRILDTRVPFYQNLSEADKTKFEQRLNLFLPGKDFQAMKLDDVGEDVKAAIAISAVQLTFKHEENWLIEEYEKIILYPHPFPTPQYEDWHITEHFEEDGVLIFAVQHVMHGFFQPLQYLNIALYEWANIYIKLFPLPETVLFNEDSWSYFKIITSWEEAKIKNYVGLQDMNPTALGITLFFTHNQTFRKVLPKECALLEKHFL